MLLCLSTLYEKLCLAQAGNSDAILEIIDKFKPIIQKCVRQLNYECAETDLVIFLLLLLSKIELKTFAQKSEGEQINYFLKAIRNKQVDLYRKNQSHSLQEISLFDVCELSIEPEYLMQSELCILNSLPERQRKVLELHFIDGYSDTDVAAILGTSRQAVGQSRRRAIMNLKKIRKEVN